MYGAVLLKSIDDAGVAVLTLTEGLGEDELAGSRLTRSEVIRHLNLLANAAESLPIELKQKMPEVNWAAWQTAQAALLGSRSAAQDEALGHAVQALVPGTLMWLRLYQQNQPDLFRLTLA